MNWKRLPKEKRQKLIMVVAGTVLAVAALYFLLDQDSGSELR